MTTVHTVISIGASTGYVAASITTHAELTTGVHGVGGATVSDQVLKAWTESGAYEMTTITYHGTNTKAVSTATVKWPDGSAGTFTTTAYNTTASPARVNAYTITHTLSGKTVTQAACTLNGDGEITTKPALTVV